MKYLLVVFCVTLLATSCRHTENGQKRVYDLSKYYQSLLEYPIDSSGFPRSYDFRTNSVQKVPSKDWTSGFFPGSLLFLYELTDEKKYLDRAQQWLPFIEKEKFNDGTHDMGFKIYCSFGNANRITPNKTYENIILHSANTLITRFNPKVGCIRSWDFGRDKWQYPVIIDNMMNLELLFEATKISGDSTYHNIAVQHANTTLKNHFRDDGSSFHVVDYDTITGNILQRVTHQGFAPSSSWARGQAWGIYGFSMAYRYTKNKAYLEMAKANTNFFLNHKNLPEDGIPYWDFDAPNIPNAPRDVSAAAIVASAMYELHQYDKDEAYLNYANDVMKQLGSGIYLLPPDGKAPFILSHSTGNFPKNSEIDVAINYADYYFLEALTRKKLK